MLVNRISPELERERQRAERWKLIALVAIILAVGSLALLGSILLMIAQVPV